MVPVSHRTRCHRGADRRGVWESDYPTPARDRNALHAAIEEVVHLGGHRDRGSVQRGRRSYWIGLPGNRRILVNC